MRTRVNDLRHCFAVVALSMWSTGLLYSDADMVSRFDWKQLPSIPDKEGFAGVFSGVVEGALVVAGGANIVGDRWFNPLQKKWYDSVFILDRPDGLWKVAPTLAKPVAYGVSITTSDGLICIGGSNSDRHLSEVFRLSWRDGKLCTEMLPSLPRPCANACGALLGATVYVAGGIESPDALHALKSFWALDLNAPEQGWRELEPWPGEGRMLAVAGAMDGSFFLFSGASIAPDHEGKSVRTYLRDAYRFTPESGWKRLCDLPRAAVAAPSPAPCSGKNELLIFSGDDGSLVHFSPIQEHPGFTREVLSYDLLKDQWKVLGGSTISRVTVPLVLWRNCVVIPNGEVRPRVRTPEIWSTPISNFK